MTPLRQKSRIGQILMCFSIYTNTKIILNTKLNADEIPVIHGLKFLTMSWIIIFHTIFFLMDYVGEQYEKNL